MIDYIVTVLYLAGIAFFVYGIVTLRRWYIYIYILARKYEKMCDESKEEGSNGILEVQGDR